MVYGTYNKLVFMGFLNHQTSHLVAPRVVPNKIKSPSRWMDVDSPIIIGCRELDPSPCDVFSDMELVTKRILTTVLGGELPTNRFCGLVHSSDFSGLTRSLSHVNHWGYNPLTIRGMSHHVATLPGCSANYQNFSRNFRIKWRYCTIFLGIFCGDVP